MGAGPAQMAGNMIPHVYNGFQQGPDKGPLFVPPGPATRVPGPDKGPLFTPPGPAVRPEFSYNDFSSRLTPTDPSRLADPSRPWELRLAETGPTPMAPVISSGPTGSATPPSGSTGFLGNPVASPSPIVRPNPQNDVMRQSGLLGAFNPPRYF